MGHIHAARHSVEMTVHWRRSLSTPPAAQEETMNPTNHVLFGSSEYAIEELMKNATRRFSKHTTCAVLPCDCCDRDDEFVFCCLNQKMMTTVDPNICRARHYPIPQEIAKYRPSLVEDGILIWALNITGVVIEGGGVNTLNTTSLPHSPQRYMVVTKSGFYTDDFAFNWGKFVLEDQEENDFSGYVFDANHSVVGKKMKAFVSRTPRDGIQFVKKNWTGTHLSRQGYMFNTGNPDLNVAFHKVIQGQLRICREQVHKVADAAKQA